MVRVQVIEGLPSHEVSAIRRSLLMPARWYSVATDAALRMERHLG